MSKRNKANPYEQGATDYDLGRPSSNPYLTFSEKWGLYNRGYNGAVMRDHDWKVTCNKK